MTVRSVIVAAVTLLVTAGSVYAQDGDTGKKEKVIGKWYPEAEAGVTLSQSAFSDNWAGGDKGSIVWTAIFNASLQSQLHKKINFYNILKLAYGQTHQQKADADGGRYWEKPAKSTDLIDLETIFRFTLGGWVDPYVSGRFESQFEDASDPAGRMLSLNPMKFKQSGGIARKFIDTEEEALLSRFGFTFRESRRKVFANPAPDQTTASETSVDGGLEWTIDYKAKILSERVAWTSKFTAYKPVFYSGSDEFDAVTGDKLEAAGFDRDLSDYPMMVDLDWENIFSTQITKILSVNLYVRWVYDKYENSVIPMLNDDGDITNPGAIGGAIRKAGQFKQTLAIGLTYRLL
ncbi:MAG: hypothetical protein Kow0074_15240 [Candidatus Zixiibacteriota bacterium]